MAQRLDLLFGRPLLNSLVRAVVEKLLQILLLHLEESVAINLVLLEDNTEHVKLTQCQPFEYILVVPD